MISNLRAKPFYSNSALTVETWTIESKPSYSCINKRSFSRCAWEI